MHLIDGPAPCGSDSVDEGLVSHAMSGPVDLKRARSELESPSGLPDPAKGPYPVGTMARTVQFERREGTIGEST